MIKQVFKIINFIGSRIIILIKLVVIKFFQVSSSPGQLCLMSPKRLKTSRLALMMEALLLWYLASTAVLFGAFRQNYFTLNSVFKDFIWALIDITILDWAKT